MALVGVNAVGCAALGMENDPFDEDVAKARTADEADNVRRIRRQFQNSLQLATNVLNDRDIWMVVRLIVFVLEVPRKWHGLQVKHMKSAAASLA